MLSGKFERSAVSEDRVVREHRYGAGLSVHLEDVATLEVVVTHELDHVEIALSIEGGSERAISVRDQSLD